MALLAGIAVGMSMLPEEFPVVLAVFMAMGAWRISQARVLTRRASAIETLGAATVLCTDKTGTLTENRMTIAELRLADGDAIRDRRRMTPLPEPFRDLAIAGALAIGAAALRPDGEGVPRAGASALQGRVPGRADACASPIRCAPIFWR